MSRGERLVYGVHAVRKALASGRALRICLQEDLGRQRLGRLADELAESRVPVERLPADELEGLTGTSKHQGMAAWVKVLPVLDERGALDFVAGLEMPLLLVLDGISDPRNFGALLRTADAAGVDLVVSGRSRNVGLTPVASKVAAGAAEVQHRAEVANLARFLAALGKTSVHIVGTDDMAPQSLYEAELDGPLALVMGAEGRGMRRLTRERCDQLVSLPMSGVVESLNVSVAAGICLYEAGRQRLAKVSRLT